MNNFNLSKGINKQKGYATLFTSMVVLSVNTVALMKTAAVITNQQRISSAKYNNIQAAQAAEAGVEYAHVNLLQNTATIMGGTFPTAPQTGSLTNSLGQKVTYTTTYTQPYPTTNPGVIQINSTGKSVDGSANYNIKKQLYADPIGNSLLSYTVVAQNGVSLSGNATIENNDNFNTISSGSYVNFFGYAGTSTQWGGSRCGGGGYANSSYNSFGSQYCRRHCFKSNRRDYRDNDSGISSYSNDNLFYNTFNQKKSNIKANADVVFSGSNVNLGNGSNINLYNGQTVWIDGSLILSGNTTLGSPTNPVRLIVNGNCTLKDNAQIYGVVYVANTVSSWGNTVKNTVTYQDNCKVTGATISEGYANISSSRGCSHSDQVITNSNLGGAAGYVTGSWIDF